jgi:hypothetical protein
MTRPKFLGGLGFRDLELFNLALLVRLAWRILNEPDSLIARILKAIYFSNTSFLDAELNSHPSQIWRSILDGREVLIQGLITRIGDGRSTNIWADNWIPRDTNLRPIVSLKNQPPERVCELIDATSASLKVDLIHETFLPMDASIILNITICTRLQSDSWAWHFDRKGMFFVRSAYRMLVNTKINRENYFEGNTGSSRVEEEKKGW